MLKMNGPEMQDKVVKFWMPTAFENDPILDSFKNENCLHNT